MNDETQNEISEIIGFPDEEGTIRHVVGMPYGVRFDDRRILGIFSVTDNFGDHGVGWFHVYGDGDKLLCRVQHKSIAVVRYK